MRRRDNDSDGASGDGTVGTFETLRDEGEHFVHVQQYVKAIESFTKALEMKENDETCLVIRAKCHLMLGNSEKALIDANTAIEQEEEGKKNIRALNMKAEALYQKGDFETALVYYHRGNKLRPELQEFRLGIQKCQEAIDNSIGSPGAVKLESSGDLSYFYKEDEKMKQQQKGFSISKTQKKEERKERQRPKDGSNTKTTKELLGQLYRDKEYLEKLFDSLSTNSSRTDDFIKGRACDGLEYLTVRSDFWRQQKPMYARKRDRQSRSARSGGQRDPMKFVLQKLVEIDDAQTQGKYQESLDKSKKTMNKVEEMPEDSLKNKPDVMANLYSCMGNAYLEMNLYNDALKCHKQDLSIAKDNGLDEAESRALDNLGRTCARMGDFGEAILIWQKKLPKSKSPLESTWLYHEIGRCHLELAASRTEDQDKDAEYQDAKEFGEKSLAAAKEADDQGWQLHACVLIAQSEVKCGELEAASETFTKALDLAEDQNDTSAQTAIKKALEEVNERIVQGGNAEEDGDGHKEDSTPAKEDKKALAKDDKKAPAKEEKKGGAKSPPRAPSPKEEKAPAKKEETPAKNDGDEKHEADTKKEPSKKDETATISETKPAEPESVKSATEPAEEETKDDKLKMAEGRTEGEETKKNESKA